MGVFVHFRLGGTPYDSLAAWKRGLSTSQVMRHALADGSMLTDVAAFYEQLQAIRAQANADSSTMIAKLCKTNAAV